MEEIKTLPRTMLVWDNCDDIAVERNVTYIGLCGSCLSDGYSGLKIWNHCKEIPEVREMTHAEMFKFLRDGGVVRNRNYPKTVIGYWTTEHAVEDYEICLTYTGTDSDIWTKAEFEA